MKRIVGHLFRIFGSAVLACCGMAVCMAETVVDVMVVYPEQVRLDYGDADGVEAEVLANFASSNQAMANSGVDLRFRLVHLLEVSYSESATSMNEDLDALTERDGVMDEVHTARDEYGADLVCFFRSDSVAQDGRETLGLAWILEKVAGDAVKAFSVVSAQHSLSSHVFAHELGHNFGAAHDRDNASNSGLYPYSYGYRFRPTGEDEFRTVMGYPPGVPLNMFSNPDTLHLGHAAGTSSEDNARGLRNMMGVISGYRGHKHRFPVADAGRDRILEDKDGDGLVKVWIDGQGSFAEDGVATWKWTWAGGSSNEAFFDVYLPLGTTVFDLKITDADGYESLDQVAVQVLENGTVVKTLAGSRRSLVLKDNGLVYLFGDSYQRDGFYAWDWAASDPDRAFVNARVVDIAMGADFALFVHADGSLWGVGDNRRSSLGLEVDAIYSEPVVILEEGVASVSASGSYSLITKDDGSVWAMGTASEEGQFGLGDRVLCEVPTQIIGSGVSRAIAGFGSGFFLMKDGSVKASGLNDVGQLGIDSANRQWRIESPIEILSSEAGVVDIAQGFEHTLFLKSDGSLWGMGSNRDGQLGAVSKQNYFTPVLVHEGPVSAIGANGDMSYFALSNGSLWMTGDRSDNYQNRFPFLDEWRGEPTQVLRSGVENFVFGALHGLVLRNDGSLWGIGENNNGQLGVGRSFTLYLMHKSISGNGSRTNFAPVVDLGEDIEYADWDGDGFETVYIRKGIDIFDDWQIKELTWVFGFELSDDLLVKEKRFPVGETMMAVNAVDDDGLVSSDQRKVIVKPYSGVSEIAHLGQKALVLKEDGSAWLAGLGRDSLTVWPRLLFSGGIKKIVEGEEHCFLIDESGGLWGLGSNDAGQLGIEGGLSYETPVQVRESGVVSAATGLHHSLFVTSEGALWGMGANFSGQLGIGSTDAQKEAVQILDTDVTQVVASGDASFFVKSDGSLWGMGSGYSGLLGEANSNQYVLEPTLLRSEGVRRVAVGDGFLLLIDTSGDLWAYGSNPSVLAKADGLPVFASNPVQLLAGPVESVALVGSSLMALFEDGKVAVLGRILKQRLGLEGTSGVWGESTLYLSGAIAVHLYGDEQYGSGYIVRDDGSLWIFGSSVLGDNPYQTGENAKRPWLSLDGARPTANTAPVAVAGDDFQVVDFGGDGVEEIVLDGRASHDDWQIASWSWSWEVDGSLVTKSGSTARASLPVGENRIQLKVLDDDGNEGVDYLTVTVGGESVVLDVSLGYDGTLFVDKSGALFGGGLNTYGSLGARVPLDNSGLRLVRTGGVVAASIGSSHSLFQDEEGALWGLGANYSGMLGVGRDISYSETPLQIIEAGVVQFSAGYSHSVALLENGSLWSWGENEDGQLGNGTLGDAYKPVKVVDSGVVKVLAGLRSTVFLKTDGSLWGMGRKEYLGDLGGGSRSATEPVLLYESGIKDFKLNYDRLSVLKEDGSLWKEDGDGAILLYEGGVVDAAVTPDYTMILDDQKSLWAWGSTSKLRLRSRQGPNSLFKILEGDIVSLSASRNNVFIHFSDGRIWGAGEYAHGELGLLPDSVIGWKEIQGPIRVGDSGLRTLRAGPDQLLFLRENEESVPVYLVGNEAAATNVTSWRWSLDDVEIGTGLYEKAEHSEVGRFHYKLEIIDSVGNSQEDTLWVEVRPYEAFRTWALGYFDSDAVEASGFEKGDPDRDHLDNAMEMILDRNPLVSDAGFRSKMSFEENSCYIEILDPLPNLSYSLWEGSDLIEWRLLSEKEAFWKGDRLVFEIDPDKAGFYRYSIVINLNE